MDVCVGEECGYRWVILGLAFVSCILTWGVMTSVGVFYAEWVHYFNAPMKVVAFAGGLQCAVACLVGPLCSIILHRLGIRTSGIVGGILMSSGIILSYFSQSIPSLCLSFGVIGGIGTGLCIMSTSGIVNWYFLKQRTLAESIYGTGTAFGTFCLPLLQNYLVSLYAWQGASLIVGALCLNNVVISLLFLSPSHIEKFPVLKKLGLCRRKIIQKTVENTNNNEPGECYEDNCLSKTSYGIDSGEDLPQIATMNHKSLLDSRRPVDSIPSDELTPSEGDLDFKLEEEKSFLRRSLKIWGNFTFVVLVIMDLMCWLCYFVTYVHIVERARVAGVDDDTSTWLSSAIGLAGMIGRPLTGIFLAYFRIHPFPAYLAIQFLIGVANIASSFWSDVYGLFAYACVFGFLSNGYSLMKSCLALMLGTRQFVDSYSWLALFEGVGIFVGPVFAGWVYDITNSYVWPFRLAGAGLLLACGIGFLRMPHKIISSPNTSS